jgi:hypothetical protein
VAGGLDGVGHAVVLAGLPHDRIPVVLAAVVNGHSDAEGECVLALGDGQSIRRALEAELSFYVEALGLSPGKPDAPLATDGAIVVGSPDQGMGR